MEFPRTKFTPLAIEERPHDTTGLAKGWSFKTLEHDAHTFPHAIQATDPQGRSATYVPLKIRGRIGRWMSETE